MSTSLDAAVAALDWPALYARLDAEGHALTPPLLDAAQRAALIAIYDEPARFRSRIVMQRHGFGRGEYQYFAYPLPPAVQALRAAFYERLAPLANAWAEKLGEAARYPPRLDAFLAGCHGAGQTRPTPLLLRYGADDYNCLHQDLYGAWRFPLQLVFQLSEPGIDFRGGELVLVEQRPRLQSIARVLDVPAGGAAIIAVHHRPVAGTRGWYRTQLRHGVSRVHAGRRHTLGLVLHDAA
ncbi:2OG-Fe(II) oxygenase [Solimonas soli]|uniref:2OG-Fe(II) oxygenase n=1 Tax=Solimonas soli TaxID=413479 RepID=UPI00048875A7|nr:2OG-Fe(II) oxygenase [Solimonas soli]